MKDEKEFELDEESEDLSSSEEKEKYFPYVKSRSKNEKKHRVSMFTFILISAVFVGVLVCGILAHFDIRVLAEDKNQNIFYGKFWIALFFSYGLFFFSLSPFKKISNWIRIPGFFLTILVFGLMQLYPIMHIVHNKGIYMKNHDFSLFGFNDYVIHWMTIVGAFVGTITLYSVCWFKFDFKDVKSKEAKFKDDGGILNVIFTVFKAILLFFVKTVFWFLKLKEKSVDVFIIILVPVSILLMSYVTELLIVLLLLFILFFFLNAVEGMILMSSPGGSDAKNQISITNDMGCQTILTEESPGHYYDGSGGWYTDNGDGTVTPDTY